MYFYSHEKLNQMKYETCHSHSSFFQFNFHLDSRYKFNTHHHWNLIQMGNCWSTNENLLNFEYEFNRKRNKTVCQNTRSFRSVDRFRWTAELLAYSLTVCCLFALLPKIDDVYWSFAQMIAINNLRTLQHVHDYLDTNTMRPNKSFLILPFAT